MSTSVKPYWLLAHRKGKDGWNAVMGTENCPYCGHRQNRHVVNVEPGTREITIACDDCGPVVEPRTCIIVRGAARRAGTRRARPGRTGAGASR